MQIPDFTNRIWKKIYIYLFTLAILVGVSVLFLPDGKLHIFFLDVDQGDSILIQTPGNQNVLIDGGPQNKVLEELGDVLFFMDKTIDLMILTHPHADHVDGLSEVLKRYNVKKVLYTGVKSGNAAYKEFVKQIKVQNIPFIFPKSDQDFNLGHGVFIDILYPIESLFNKEVENLNNSSIALILNYRKRRILLTGDGEHEEEYEILEAGFDVEADLFKAGHHGSRTASSEALLKASQPEKVIIQCGTGNNFGHPHYETLSKFTKMNISDVKRNDLDGRVEYVF